MFFFLIYKYVHGDNKISGKRLMADGREMWASSLAQAHLQMLFGIQNFWSYCAVVNGDQCVCHTILVSIRSMFKFFKYYLIANAQCMRFFGCWIHYTVLGTIG